MANIIFEDTTGNNYGRKTWIFTILTGLALGVIYWLLSRLLHEYAVQPLLCQLWQTSGVCTDSREIAGHVATILVAVIGLFVTVKLRIFRPLLVVVAVAATLWGLSEWLQGLRWPEAVAYSALLYALGYALFSWVTRGRSLIAVTIIILVIVAIARILFLL
ncbi:MAG: rane protein of unknown function [Candidatus Saccharibacteria bacterium]|nr:rane protein of unknown function [Candidatus Saccharibacteria bacterium]